MKCSRALADWRFNALAGSSVVGGPCPEQPVPDSYAVESRGESFADASEAFFQEPAALARRIPALYRALADVYRIDPAVS